MNPTTHLLKYILLLLPLVLLVTVFYTLVFFFNMHNLYEENHVLEDTQVTLIALAGLLCLFSHRTVNERWKYWYSASFTLLCYSFLVRELDMEVFNIPEIIIALTSGLGRNILIATGWIAVLFYMFKHFGLYKAGHKKFLATATGRLLMLSALGLFFSYLFDKQLTFLAYHVFFEELVEVCAYYSLLIAAYLLPHSLQQLPQTEALTSSTECLQKI